jgi:ParB/RepB/Spo0J family partition protein
MTSGVFHSLAIDTITVSRETRQRKKLGDIDELADSIRRLGLIHPVVVTRDLELVAGERRLSACKQLGHTHIACQYTDELDPQALRVIELEENTKRLELPWQEQGAAVREYNKLQATINPAWTQEKTAAALGIDQSYVSQQIKVITAAEKNPDILKLDNFTTAFNMVRRQEDRHAAAALAALNVPTEHDPVQVADFNEWAQTYSGQKFNFIHCDFPYGIKANKIQQGASVATHGSYEDDEKTYWKLLASLCANLDRFCAASAHLMFWFSMHRYERTLQFLRHNSNFKIDDFPLIWHKSDNKGVLNDPQRGPRRVYETCLFGSRGDMKIVASVSNVVAAPAEHEIHMSTKPQPMLEKFFEMFVDEHSHVLDPTCGSGTALRAAKALGAARVLGLEINRDFAELANIVLAMARRDKNDEPLDAA